MRVTRLDTIPFSVPLAPPSGGRPHPLGAGFLTYCLVRAETDDGLIGWGEISDGWGCEYAEVAGALVREALSRFVLDEDPRNVAAIAHRMWTWLRRRQGTVWLVAQAVSGVELALWDLIGRAAGAPVCQLLGPPVHSSVPIYASGNFLSQGDASVHAAFFQPALERGVRTVKVRLGPAWEAELEVLTDLKGRLGSDVRVGIDGNEAFSAKTAARIAQRLGDIGVAFFEEPILRIDRRALQWLVSRSPVPIAYGEHVHTAEGFREVGDERLADIWQPDATVCGGLLEMRAIGGLAASRGTPISPHSATSPLGVAANLHASTTAPTLSWLEYSAGSIVQLAPYFRGADQLTLPAVSDGRLPVPSSPGLGIEPDLEALRETFPYRPPWPLKTPPTLYTGSV